MVAFFIIAAAAGALTVAATATQGGGKLTAHDNSAPRETKTALAPVPAKVAASLDTSAYGSVSDCLTAAALAGFRLDACSPPH